MFNLKVTGRGPRRRCEGVCMWFIGKYLPRHKLDITVNHKGLLCEGVFGYCTVEDYNYRPRCFLIELHTNLPKDLYCKTLLHELQHVLQHVRGDLRDKHQKRLWKGIDCSELNYDEQPWELDAMQMEEVLYQEYLTTLS